MQTFLPYVDFHQTAKVLDNKRLGKQRVEAFQILKVLLDPTSKQGWRNHPAVLMWKGHEKYLCFYMNEMIMEWVQRGFNNTMVVPWGLLPDSPLSSPGWMGDPAFHASHRSNLLRKDPVHYGQFGWTEPPTLEYVWPVRREACASS